MARWFRRAFRQLRLDRERAFQACVMGRWHFPPEQWDLKRVEKARGR